MDVGGGEVVVGVRGLGAGDVDVEDLGRPSSFESAWALSTKEAVPKEAGRAGRSGAWA